MLAISGKQPSQQLRFRFLDLLQYLEVLSVIPRNGLESSMFTDRTDAGNRLAAALDDAEIAPDTVVSIAPCGIPVGKPVATRFDSPLHVTAAEEIDAPFNPQLAIGAVTADGTTWLDQSLIASLDIVDQYVDDGVEAEQRQAEERRQQYSVEGRDDFSDECVVLVNDGVATGAVERVCVNELYDRGAAEVVVATPVISATARAALASTADQIVAVVEPDDFIGTGQHYKERREISDEEAAALLE